MLAFFYVISRPETWLQINQFSVLGIARVSHNKCQGKWHQWMYPHTQETHTHTSGMETRASCEGRRQYTEAVCLF